MDGADIFSVTGAIGGAGHIFSLAYFRPPLAILVSITLRLWTARPPTSLAESAHKPSGECLTGRRGVAASFGPVLASPARPPLSRLFLTGQIHFFHTYFYA